MEYIVAIMLTYLSVRDLHHRRTETTIPPQAVPRDAHVPITVRQMIVALLS